MDTGSLPWAIHHAPQQGVSQHPPPKRNKMLSNKWALRDCSHCHENFIPSTTDAEFCSGDCRLSCSILRHTRASEGGSGGGLKKPR